MNWQILATTTARWEEMKTILTTASIYKGIGSNIFNQEFDQAISYLLINHITVKYLTSLL